MSHHAFSKGADLYSWNERITVHSRLRLIDNATLSRQVEHDRSASRNKSTVAKVIAAIDRTSRRDTA